MSAAHAFLPHLSTSVELSNQSKYRLLLSSLGNFLHDLEQVRHPFRDAEGIGGLPVATWQDSEHLYVEGDFQFQVDSGRDVDINVVEGRFFIRMARH